MTNSKSKLFEGAGVIVRKPGNAESGKAVIVVETEHAEQVSGLFFALKDVFASDLDFYNKYEFYGRLANSANNRLCNGDDLEALCGAVVGEACAIAEEMGSHLYFAYGSNMDVDQMSHRCPESVFVGTASLQNYAFELDSAGVATVVENRGSTVYGALWLISESDERKLDGYEGVGSGCYRKESHLVLADERRNLPVLVYISNRGVHDGATYRSGYMDNIIANARRLGFDAEYVERLEAK